MPAQLVLMLSPKGVQTYVVKGDVESFEAAGFTWPKAATASPEPETPRRRGRPRGRPKAATASPEPDADETEVPEATSDA